ncbi:MAG TPA: hypothetical protein VMR25_02295 [Planctomycetaceae bacterium]|jgi:hypothetical protein|nr:hypothetical protein [Planctomycetaceae bacterium]
MMHFTNPAGDGPFFAELRESGILAPDVIDRINESMGRPEAGTLNDFLLAGADLIPEKPWLAWLIRRHECHRFGRVNWHEEIAPLCSAGPAPGGNVPYRKCHDGSMLVAILRPDCRKAAEECWPTLRLWWAAATLSELRELGRAWKGAV